ncbi:MAG: transglutaminase family protein [Lysinibacillus sp.]
MKFEIQHTNTFQYESKVDQSLNTIRLKPRGDERQRLLSYHITISPSSLIRENIDIWGNTIGTFYIPELHSELAIQSTSIVSIQKAPIVNNLLYSPEMQRIFHSQFFSEQYLPFLKQSQSTYLTQTQLNEVFQFIGHGENPILFALHLMHYIYSNFTYDAEATNVNTIATEAFTLKRGVCQDFTHIMISVLRAKGIPARYVSGYLYVEENSALIGDLATHAWVEVMIPGIGWIGLDPTNNVEVLENHIILSIGRDYLDVSPMEGVYTGGRHQLNVKVEVKSIDHY